MSTPSALQIEFYQDEGCWWASCLDIHGDGETKEEAFLCLVRALEIQIELTIEHGNLANLWGDGHE